MPFFVTDSNLDPWLGPWQVRAPSGNPLETGWYASGLHHVAVFDAQALGEPGTLALKERWRRPFADMLAGKGRQVWPGSDERASAGDVIPLATVSKEPLATPFDSVQQAAILFVAKGRVLDAPVLLLNRDAITPTVFVVADTLASLGLERAHAPLATESESAKDEGNVQLTAGRSAAAIERYRAAILLDWNNDRAMNNYGRAIVDDDNVAAALFRMAIRLAPREIKAMLSLIVHLRNLGQDEEALWWAKRAKKVGTKDASDKRLLEELLASFG